MKRLDMIKILSDGSPFDLNNSATNNAFLGMKTEIRRWCTYSTMWQNTYGVLVSSHWLMGEDSEGRRLVDFKPMFSLDRDAFRKIRETLNFDLDRITDDEARALLVTLASHWATESFIAFLTGVSKWEIPDIENYNYETAVARLDIETVWETLSWLSQHVYCEDVMTKDEKLYAAEMAFQE